MPPRETLQRIITEFTEARKQPLEAHPLARFIRAEAEQTVTNGLGHQGGGLLVQGSPGQGNWAAIPWIAVFDPVVTTSAIRGYYVVYLFHATEPVAFLSLNQGTTSTRQEFGPKTREVLSDRAHFVRKRLPEFVSAASILKIETGSDARLPGGMRLAYLVVPEVQVERFEQVTESLSAGCPGLTQTIVTAFIAEGHFARHIQRMRKLYAERREATAAGLESVLGKHVRIDLQPGGMHLILRLRGQRSDRRLAARMREQGLYAEALTDWTTRSDGASALLLNFTNIDSRRAAEKFGQRILRLM